MNHEALLLLIGDLMAQAVVAQRELAVAQERIAELEAALDEQSKPKP